MSSKNINNKQICIHSRLKQHSLKIIFWYSFCGIQCFWLRTWPETPINGHHITFTVETNFLLMNKQRCASSQRADTWAQEHNSSFLDIVNIWKQTTDDRSTPKSKPIFKSVLHHTQGDLHSCSSFWLENAPSVHKEVHRVISELKIIWGQIKLNSTNLLQSSLNSNVPLGPCGPHDAEAHLNGGFPSPPLTMRRSYSMSTWGVGAHLSLTCSINHLDLESMRLASLCFSFPQETLTVSSAKKKPKIIFLLADYWWMDYEWINKVHHHPCGRDIGVSW